MILEQVSAFEENSCNLHPPPSTVVGRRDGNPGIRSVFLNFRYIYAVLIGVFQACMTTSVVVAAENEKTIETHFERTIMNTVSVDETLSLNCRLNPVFQGDFGIKRFVL